MSSLDALTPKLLAAIARQNQVVTATTPPDQLVRLIAAACRPPRSIHRSIEAQLKKLLAKIGTPARKHPPKSKYLGEPVYIAFDSEYVTWHDESGGARNEVLAIFVVVRCGDKATRLKLVPPGPDREHRPTMRAFIQKALSRALREGTISAIPDYVMVFSHFARADLPAMLDFFAFKRQFKGVGKTVVSQVHGHLVESSSTYGDEDERKWWDGDEDLTVRDAEGHRFTVRVIFRDTITLTPGRKGLAYAAQLVEMKKLGLHEDLGIPNQLTEEREGCDGRGHEPRYGITRMDLVARDYPEEFDRYGFQDAEIAMAVGLRVIDFARNELGLKHLPTTLAACALGFLIKQLGGREHVLELTGRQSVKSVRFNETARRYVTRRAEERTAGAEIHYGLLRKSFHGGDNQCFYHGPTPVGRYYDYDLPGAYTTAMVPLKPLDYENADRFSDAAEIVVGDAAFAWIEFKYPRGTRFPGIPVRAPDDTLYFVLEGRKRDNVYACGPEIMVAREAGACIRVIQGVRVPWKGDTEPFRETTAYLQQKRRDYPAKEYPAKNAMYKEIANSGFGLTAKGLREKRVFDPSSLKSQFVGTSMLTEPGWAAHITSTIRAVAAEILSRLPSEVMAVSFTTDGGVFSAPIEELDLSGPLCSYFADIRESLFGKREVFDPEPKHVVRQLVSVATRTAFTAAAEPGSPLICTKGGVKPPPHYNLAQENRFMLKRYLLGRYGQQIEHEQLVSAREQWTHELDLVAIKRTRKLNLRFDFKRRPVNPRMVKIGRHREMIAWDTMPWDHLDEALFARAHAEAWMRERQRLITTLGDFLAWESHFEASYAAKLAADRCGGRAMEVRQDGAWGVLKRVFLHAACRGVWGAAVPKGRRMAVANALTAAGFETVKDDVTYAERRTAALVENSIAVLPETVAMLRVILQHCPAFEYQRVFRADRLDELEALLAAAADTDGC